MGRWLGALIDPEDRSTTVRSILAYALIAIIPSAGCVHYAPVELAAVPPDQEVRVRLTNDGAVRMARHLGRITDDVTANVAPSAGDSISVTIWLGKNYPGTPFEDVRETIVLPQHEVAALRFRKLSVWRTAAASAAALAGFAILVDRLFQIGDPNPPSDEEPPRPSPATFFRIRLGRVP